MDNTHATTPPDDEARPAITTWLIFQEEKKDSPGYGLIQVPTFLAARDVPQDQDAGPGTVIREYLEDTNSPSGIYYVMEEFGKDQDYTGMHRYTVTRRAQFVITRGGLNL